MTLPTFDLSRFTLAQDGGGSYARALAELRAGSKMTHWIWWVFPQIRGLGISHVTAMYALSGRAEACAYLVDEVLRARLVAAYELVEGQLSKPRPPHIDELMGSETDALKLVSSATLFHEIAGDDSVRALPGVERLKQATTAILERARGAGYPACQHTLTLLRA